MKRTIISLSDQEKQWLDQQATTTHLSKTELVRKALECYRHHCASPKRPRFDDLLKKTQGLWVHEDGLTYQQKIRDEWERDER